VASLARGREPRGDVVRVVRSLIIRLMAAIAGRRQRRVVVVHMALRARNRHVEARQRECCQIVIKRCLQPRRGVVAHLAGVREPNGSMRRVICAVVIRHVTS